MFKTIRSVVSARELKSTLLVPPEIALRRASEINTIADIIAGKDKRKLFVIGPCSADNEDAVCDYAVRLARVADEIKDVIHVVVRAHTCKPRTRGEGYMGLLHAQKDDSGSIDMSAGLIAMRRLHIRIAEESGLFTADEMLYPDTLEYIDDIVSYITLGARSSDDQFHRFVASGTDIPVGVKNPVNGNLSDLASSVHAVSISNDFIFNGSQVKSSGNRSAHAILRGFLNADGYHMRNCGEHDIKVLYDSMKEQGVNTSVIIDAGHSNSGKDPFMQESVVTDVLKLVKHSPQINSFVKGFMIESYIEDGNQKPDGGIYGKSITDGCLGFEKTERLLLSAANLC